MTDVPADLEGGLTEPEELEPEQGTLRLASPDDDHDATAWEAATAAVLRKSRRLGDDDPDSGVWAALTRTTLDGIDVAPIGSAADLEGLTTAGRPTRATDWDIRAHVSGPDAAQANEAMLVDLDNGATSLWVELGAGLGVDDLPRALQGVLLDLAPVVLSGSSAAAARALVALAEDTGVDLHPGTNFGADPLADDLVEIATLAHEHGVLGVVASGLPVHEQGASDAQELGVAIAAGVTALRALTDAGMTAQDAAAVIEFRLAVTDEQFPSIAKLRAARRLWARVLEASGVDDLAMRQHAVTSRPQMSRFDPWVNMLRGTVAAFAAGVGGAEAVTVIAVRRAARPARRARAPGRAQHLLAADLRVPPRPRRRSRRWLVRRREADRRPRDRRLGRAPGDRGGRRAGRRRGSRRPDRGRRRRTRRAGRQARAAADRSQRVPAPRRDAPATHPHRPSARTSVATATPSRRCATRRPPPRSSSPPWAPSRRTPPAPRSPPTSSPLGESPSGWPDRPTASSPCSPPTRANGWSAWPGPTRRTPSGAPPSWQPCATPEPRT